MNDDKNSFSNDIPRYLRLVFMLALCDMVLSLLNIVTLPTNLPWTDATCKVYATIVEGLEYADIGIVLLICVER